jgi:hypothetical protein
MSMDRPLDIGAARRSPRSTCAYATAPPPWACCRARSVTAINPSIASERNLQSSGVDVMRGIKSTFRLRM